MYIVYCLNVNLDLYLNQGKMTTFTHNCKYDKVNSLIDLGTVVKTSIII